MSRKLLFTKRFSLCSRSIRTWWVLAEGDMKPTGAETSEEASVLKEKELRRRTHDIETLNQVEEHKESEGGKGKGKAGFDTK
ncbi:hypothetical protein EUX98_g8046 [Antrodiella citrinella]|uniref:Uncharacterized protein n=1 Tax=Antrodiella citrinella TaxID=2447956 RepID=A0A4S4MCJ3_9APHY|nr:hypothetical protein EUX98_g8046 [Antrodiella citrinella]